ncbi:MAG TPA: response regulator [Verrucomicrobiae bacterium]|jgi:DNA-binding NtrC family response regulator|nr:response regulator [Verrucomicrobiae bacterium]
MNPGFLKPLQVLILEDCDEDLFFLLRKLEGCGYQPDYERVCTEAATREALGRRPWDIIVSDSSLPGFDGMEALAIAREMKLNIPFILLSGMIYPEKAATAMEAGAFDCVPKNNLDLLPAVIEDALQIARSLGRGPDRHPPPTGEPVIAQCPDFRCLAYVDSDGKWREYENSSELPEVTEWFEI